MKKVLFLFLLLLITSFAKETPRHAVGVGYPGFVYRVYDLNHSSYFEWVGHLFLSKEEGRELKYKTYLGVNYAKYLFSTNNFSFKYRVGMALGLRNNEYIYDSVINTHNGYKIESNVGFVIEIYDFIANNVNLDCFAGEELIYYEYRGLVLNPILNFTFVFDY